MFKNCTKLYKTGFLKCILYKKPLKQLLHLQCRCTQPQFRPLLQVSCDIQCFRYKSKERKKKQATESESDSYEDDFIDQIRDNSSKVLKIRVTSLRMDAILRGSLGIARNKIEKMFYESKIRINGEKINKKSASVQEGDEVDLIKGPDIKNPSFMIVARVEILSVTPNEEDITLKVRRCKSLAVENYL